MATELSALLRNEGRKFKQEQHYMHNCTLHIKVLVCKKQNDKNQLLHQGFHIYKDVCVINFFAATHNNI